MIGKNKKMTAAGAASTLAAPLGFKIINWIGIIEQLTSTRMRQILSKTDVPPPQFIILNHFSHRPDEGKTVSKIAWALQQPQPGTTKTISKLLAKGLLREEPNPEDGRSKILFLSDKGRMAHVQARDLLSSGMGNTFDNWQEAEVETLFALLDQLKNQIDGDRL